MFAQRGDKHDDVLRVQKKLRAYGYTVRITGEFNLETEVAVRLFQRRHRLDIDGVVGPTTWTHLESTPELINEPRVNPIAVVNRTSYFSQRDNKSRPHSTCGPTSISMVLDYHDPTWNKATQLEDQFFWWLQQPDAQAYFRKHFPWAVGKYNPWNVAGMLKWVVETKYGLKDIFQQWSWDEIEQHLQNHGPVVVSGRFTGAGHIVVIVGMSIDGDLILHDPYGNWQKGYHRDHNGAYVIYNKEDVRSVLKPNGDKPWGHFIYRS